MFYFYGIDGDISL